MKAMQLLELKQPLKLNEIPDPHPEPGSAVVRLQAAALNRRDYWITQGMYPGISLPVTLGSDGVGTVAECHPDSELSFAENQVIINPGWGWGDNPDCQSDQFQILGMPSPGTMAEKVAVPIKYIHPKPPHLDTTAAAALPLAGLTAYRGLFVRGRLKAGENVLITGVGGGVATLAVQFAVAAGANVFVTSSVQEKIDRAVQLGAQQGWLYINLDWHHDLSQQVGAMDLIFDGAGGSGFEQLIDVAAPGGRIVNYGRTAGPPEKLEIFKVFWKQLNLLGSTMGSEQDFAAMLEFVNQHKIVPVVDLQFDWKDANQALEQMSRSTQFGKIVLTF